MRRTAFRAVAVVVAVCILSPARAADRPVAHCHPSAVRPLDRDLGLSAAHVARLRVLLEGAPAAGAKRELGRPSWTSITSTESETWAYVVRGGILYLTVSFRHGRVDWVAFQKT